MKEQDPDFQYGEIIAFDVTISKSDGNNGKFDLLLLYVKKVGDYGLGNKNRP